MGAGEFLEVAAGAARSAGALIRANLGRLGSGDVGLKKASDFVTRVDRESEALIMGEISGAFPDHAFLAEESSDGYTPGSGGYRWIIDPLDGTTNFIHEYPMFGVSIALEKDGIISSGVVYDPLRDEMFTALKGEGAWLGGQGTGRRLSVSGRTDVPACLLTTGFPFRQKHMLGKYLELFSRIFVRVSGIRRAGAAALDLAHLAAGRCDGFFELGLSPWDVAAGSMLITEAGGIITDFGGGGDYIQTGNVLAGVQAVHSVILEDAMAVFGGIVDK